MGKKAKTAITPTRSENYPQWYQEVIKAAELAENSEVRGCMVIKPWGYAIWENMQKALDKKFKDTGHENAYFPLFIPMSFLEKEAEHVEGFAKECAVVTHHRLEPDPEGGLRPAGKLENPLIVRPTSETIIGDTYSRWVQSYRDLPIKINQWANVVRWEMRTRLFLRTAEFLWQEGHTVHATDEEALEETKLMLEVYADFAEEFMAMPVIKGEKTPGERFPGAVSTLTIEAMMQDRKALQSGTSHFLGQNFAKAQEIKFQDQSGTEQFAWTTSWGLSTRMVGALIMSHSDDDGLVLPPRLAPKHVVILPIYKSDEERTQVLEYCENLRKELNKQTFSPTRQDVIAFIDDRDIRGGEKKWFHVKRGVPIRVNIGLRDIEKGEVFVEFRDTNEKASMPKDQLVSTVGQRLDEMQTNIYDRALKLREENSRTITDLVEFKSFFTPSQPDSPEIHGGFAHCYFADEAATESVLNDLKVTIRCIPLDHDGSEGECIFTGEKTTQIGVFSKAY